jgi:hypothetical protein
MKRPGSSWNFLAASLAIAGACSGGNGAPPGATGPTGEFAVLLTPPMPATMDVPAMPGRTAVRGAVANGVAPPTIAYRKAAESGGCVLLQPNQPFCDPACSSSETCGEGGRCVAHPRPLSAGVVRVRGLRTATGPTEFSMSPLAPAQSYEPPIDLELAYPPFAPGGDVEMSAAGGEVGAFVLRAKGLTPIEVMGPEPLPIQAGRALDLTWKAPSSAETTKVLISLDLTVHGAAKGKIECDVADDGAHTIPGPMVGQLVLLGTAGFPQITFKRSAVASATLQPSGRANLVLVSTVIRPVQVPGDVSCLDNSMCPPGKTCSSAFLCQ